jgi:hypothetical protein
MTLQHGLKLYNADGTKTEVDYRFTRHHIQNLRCL